MKVFWEEKGRPLEAPDSFAQARWRVGESLWLSILHPPFR